MEFLKIDKSNVNTAHEIEMVIFPEYDSLNHYVMKNVYYGIIVIYTLLNKWKNNNETRIYTR